MTFFVRLAELLAGAIAALVVYLGVVALFFTPTFTEASQCYRKLLGRSNNQGGQDNATNR